jgi:hypothetical protein
LTIVDHGPRPRQRPGAAEETEMAEPTDPRTPLELFPDGPELAPAAERGAAAVPAAVAGEPEPMALTLADLLPDAHGEIVLVNDAGVTEMALLTESRLLDQGIAAGHVTSDGLDVSGMAYYAFDSGETLYLPPDIHLQLLPDIA